MYEIHVGGNEFWIKTFFCLFDFEEPDIFTTPVLMGEELSVKMH